MKKHYIPVCSALLAFSLLSGCNANKPAEPTDDLTTPPAATETATPEETKDVSETPEATDAPSAALQNREETAELQFVVEGEAENRVVTLESLDFSSQGGPVASMYVDKEIYGIEHQEDGKYRIIPTDGNADDNYLDVTYLADTTAKDFVASYLDAYQDASVNDNGTVQIGELGKVHQLQGSNDTNSWTVYVKEVENGVVTVVITTMKEAIEGHGMRLMTLADTVSIA